MNNGFFVLDVDGHVTPDVDVDWTKYMSAAVAAEVDEAVGGKKSAMTTSRTVSDELRRQGVAQGRDPYPKRTGGWDPKARLADLDLDGIDTTVLFPTLVASGGTPVPSPLETTQGYHNWLAEFCSTNSERLKGVASIPLIKDIGVATTEVRRCVEEFGFVGISVRVHQYGRTLANTDYTELFAAADELDIPVMVHLGSRVREWFMEELNYSFTEAFGFGHPASSMIGLMDIIFGGWLETLESARFALLEGDIGWLPYWAHRLDHRYELLPHHAPLLKRKPSEYLADRRIFISCEPEEADLAYALNTLGEDIAVYSSDYPHWDCTFPGSVQELLDQDGLTEVQKRKILSQNALALLGSE